MSTRRWRRTQVIDECWQLEEEDPSFKALKEKFVPTFKGDEVPELDGWRPLACVWKACLGVDEPKPPPTFTGYVPRVAVHPWHARLAREGPQGPCRKYKTKEDAIADCEAYLEATRGT